MTDRQKGSPVPSKSSPPDESSIEKNPWTPTMKPMQKRTITVQKTRVKTVPAASSPRRGAWAVVGLDHTDRVGRSESQQVSLRHGAPGRPAR